MKFRLMAAASLALAALWGNTSSAVLVTYEGFDYPDPGPAVGPDTTDPSAGVNGGTGWSGSWFRQNNGGQYTLSGPAGSLDYPASAPLTAVGGRIDLDPGDTGDSRRQIARTLGTTYDMAADGTEFYISFLIRKNEHAAGLSDASLELNVRRGDNGTASDIRLGFGSDIDENNWLMGGVGGTGAAVLDVDTTYFMVYKVTSNTAGNGHDEIFGSVYGPGDAVPLTEPMNWMRQATVNLDVVLSQIRFRIGPNTEGGSFDEIRIGTDWAAVVPEPSSALLICMGASLCMVAARRRRAGR